ncbi:hypothetical protein [Paenibacillus sp.]|uniref:hypothetical protein n=1 Tax=Paenibacillus sp. TaxID=58172 RepID=UPI00281137EB|nr:hypothetical protein [Paenibacillus sp.]
MNKSRYVPFERNRYFYGKLLTVRDFVSEQTYVSDKRRLTNRLLFGSGVVAGLQVVAVDEKSVSVETGVALDQLGREIVVPSPVTLKLSMLEGFTNNEYAKNVYLCVGYDEKGKEPVHSVAGASGRTEEVSEHNRIMEGYRLFVREEAPPPTAFEYSDLVEETSVWYQDAQVRVLQTVPRYVTPGETFEMKIRIEKTLQTPHVEFEYTPDWTGVEAADSLLEENGGRIVFSEPTDGGKASYTAVATLRALPLPEGEASMRASLRSRRGTARLVIGERLVTELSDVRQSVEVAEESASARMLRAFHERSLDRAIDAPSEPCVYLAKVNLLQMGPTYVIDSVERMPFDEYVINPSMLYRIVGSKGGTEEIIRTVREAAASVLPALNAPIPFPAPQAAEKPYEDEEEEEAPPEKLHDTGIVEISIIPPKKLKWWHRKQRDFYSEELEHALGEGSVRFETALSDEKEELALPEMWDRRDAVYFGATEVFAKSEYDSGLPRVSIATISYPKKGTFRIGVRVLQKTDRTRLRIRWWATKQPQEEGAAFGSAFGVFDEAANAKEAAAAKS